jgi:hypothetical protein
MKLNFQLFDNFKEAARKCNLEVKPGSGYHTIKLSNGRYIFCWTPLNKMFSLYNYYENKEWDRALKHLKDNFSDFHLEFGGDDLEDMNLVCEAFMYEQSFHENMTVDQIINCIEILKDDEKLEKKLMWSRLQYGVDE